MTTIDVAMPGTCPCGEIASSPHACEHRTARQIRLCACGEWTYSPTCDPCRLPEPPPMPATAVTAAVSAGPVPADVLWLHEQTLLVGTGYVRGRR